METSDGPYERSVGCLDRLCSACTMISSDFDYEDDGFDDEDSEEDVPLTGTKPTPKWDQFRNIPPPVDTGSAVKNIWWTRGEKMMKILACVLSCAIVLVSASVSKASMFFMIKQIALDPSDIPFCNEGRQGSQYITDTLNRNFVVDFSSPDQVSRNNRALERVAWIWAIGFSFCVPQVLGFLRSLRKCLFKFNKLPTFFDLSFVLLMEVLHVTGLAILCFAVLPNIDSANGLVLSANLALVPAVVLLLSKFKVDDEGKKRVLWKTLPLDVIALLVQLSGVFIYPVLTYIPGVTTDLLPDHPYPWAVTTGLVLASCGWWETFTDETSSLTIGKWLWRVKERMIAHRGSRFIVYSIVIPFKIAVFLGLMVYLTWVTGAVESPSDLTNYFTRSFSEHEYRIVEVQSQVIPEGKEGEYTDAFMPDTIIVRSDATKHALWVLLINIFTSLIAYSAAKFAAKVRIQSVGFSLPLTCVTPLSIVLVLSLCGARAQDKCIFENSQFYIPNRLFYQCPAIGSLVDVSWDSYNWLFLVWFLSYLWISRHIWFPRSPRLGSTEQIYGTPYFDGILIDQSLMLNRRKDGAKNITSQDIDDGEEEEETFSNEYITKPESTSFSNSSIKASDRISRIYACATMWHESEEEQLEMLKSLFRVDSDYHRRNMARKYLGVVDPDYYQWETHILFDDCMTLDSDGPEEDKLVNKFVKQLVDLMDEAASRHYGKKVKIKPCKKIPTPYGGRLIWTLPGKTQIICHLKDKDKIRHKKRWSQIMYMYYLLGYKLMELPISDARKDVIAENTYLLALDGDVDFQPDAAVRLVDLMKKNKGVGAACGRIHPTGSGYMPMYQVFEYAVGHWLQKATEHVLGCVLCSPGCFSLFRAKALMDDNVMAKYTTVAKQAREHLQFDQGEDRWLCTLMLQRGWRVEYSAASDSYTACPEGFNEFFNQRRRWMPSTILNILDILENWKTVTKGWNNEDISWMYIVYQMGIMVGTFIGPGGICLALVGGCSTVFNISTSLSMILNFIPIGLYCLACYYTPSKFQLAIAQVLTLVYTCLMLAVYVGIATQIIEKGWLSATAVTTYSFFGPLLIAGLLHWQEIYCMPYSLIYFITIPSMYVLLVIYSFFNMWNVSWGTREVAVKKSKAELEREKKEEEERQAELKKKKKEGLLGTLMDQFNLGGDKGDSASVDFSVGNVLRCMCFSHEDPLEPKKQLVKVSATLDEMTKRLGRIEGAAGLTGNSIRRKSSFRGRKSLGSVIEGSENRDSRTSFQLGEEDYDSVDFDEDDDDTVPIRENERDDEKNPYWIDDDDLKDGPIDFLKGSEINFWKDLIKKYLEPLQMSAKEKDQQAEELRAYRDQLVFTFLMINVLYIVLVTMLQFQANLQINWTLFSWLGVDVNGEDEIRYNLTYTAPDTLNSGVKAQIAIGRETGKLDMIGFFFIVAFSSITLAQMVGMFFHRWQTLCHYIASTKVRFFSRKGSDKQHAVNEDMSNVANYIIDSKQGEKEKSNLMRRPTVANLKNYHMKTKGQGELINLEKQFLEKFSNMNVDNDDKMAKRLSLKRRGTIHVLKQRQGSFMKQRGSVAFQDSKGSEGSYVYNGFDSDLGDDIGDDLTDFSGSARNSVHFDVAGDTEF